MRQLPDDPYQWWIGKRVDVRDESNLWTLGEVLEAARCSLTDTSTGVVRHLPYEADPGESDGHMTVMLLDGPSRGNQAGFEIYPADPFGLVPNVTPHIKHAADIAIWWRELSAQAKAALLLAPNGPVPSIAVAEVIELGASVADAYWIDVQSGPDGLRLPSSYQRFIEDQRLLRDYSRAEHALATSRLHAGDSDSTLMSDPEVRRCFDERTRLKQLLDDFRLAEIA